MIGFADKSKQPRSTTYRRAGRGRRAVAWVTLLGWLFTFALCTADAVATGTLTAVHSDLESVTPHSSDGHQHPPPPHTDSCCTLQNIPLPASMVALSSPLHEQLLVILPLLLVLPIILLVPFRTRLHITGPPGRSRHLLLVHSISPNAPPR